MGRTLEVHRDAANDLANDAARFARRLVLHRIVIKRLLQRAFRAVPGAVVVTERDRCRPERPREGDEPLGFGTEAGAWRAGDALAEQVVFRKDTVHVHHQAAAVQQPDEVAQLLGGGHLRRLEHLGIGVIVGGMPADVHVGHGLPDRLHVLDDARGTAIGRQHHAIQSASGARPRQDVQRLREDLAQRWLAAGEGDDAEDGGKLSENQAFELLGPEGQRGRWWALRLHAEPAPRLAHAGQDGGEVGLQIAVP